MPTLYDVPEDVVRAHIVPCLPLDDIVSLMMTAPFLVLPVRKSSVWVVGLEGLNSSNTLNLAVAQELSEGQETSYFSEHVLSDPRLRGEAYSELPAITRFQTLATFCRATVGHLRALHNITGEGDWSFIMDFNDNPVTPRDFHVNMLADLECFGEGAFTRYSLLVNLIKLNVAQDELENPNGSCYWYRRLGDPDCDPDTGSSYRDTLTTYFVDAFLDDGLGNVGPDPDLEGVEVGSNAHLVHLSERFLLNGDLFGPKLLHNFELLHAAYVSLPKIIKRLEKQEVEWMLEEEAKAEAEEEKKQQLVKQNGEGGDPLVKEGGKGGEPLVKEGGEGGESLVKAGGEGGEPLVEEGEGEGGVPQEGK